MPSPLGEKAFEISGMKLGGNSKKVNPANDALPPGVVRLTAPVEPEPTMAMMVVDERTVKEETGVPPNVRANVPVRWVPVMVIDMPAAAAVGAKEVMVGGGMNVKPSREAEPPGVVRLTAPEDPVPTITTMEVEDTTVKDKTVVPPSVT